MPPISVGSEPGLGINKEKYQRPHSERLLQQILLPYMKQISLQLLHNSSEHNGASCSGWEKLLARVSGGKKKKKRNELTCCVSRLM